MKSRMDKYYDSNDTKARTSKNQQLYRTIYDEVEYSNVEGISIIEKNEKIDIDMIRELINKNNNTSKIKQVPVERPKIEVEETFDDNKSYDIRDILSKAKDNRTVDSKRVFDTQYNVLKENNLDSGPKVSQNFQEDDLKGMIEAINSNSKGYTVNLLDDLKSIYDATMHEKIENKMEEEKTVEKTTEIDRSFYTTTMGFKEEDFEDLKEIQEDVENSTLTKILIFVLCLVVIVGIIFLVFHFIR